MGAINPQLTHSNLESAGSASNPLRCPKKETLWLDPDCDWPNWRLRGARRTYCLNEQLLWRGMVRFVSACLQGAF